MRRPSTRRTITVATTAGAAVAVLLLAVVAAATASCISTAAAGATAFVGGGAAPPLRRRRAAQPERQQRMMMQLQGQLLQPQRWNLFRGSNRAATELLGKKKKRNSDDDGSRGDGSNNRRRSEGSDNDSNRSSRNNNSNNNRDGVDDDETFDTATLNERLMEMRVHIMEEEYTRPPNPDLSPTEFVSEVLKGLWNNGDPLPDSGFRLLLRASTPEWRRMVYDAVAAPPAADEEAVASAFGDAVGRPGNQFQILVGEAEDYVATFPTDPVDYGDGTCWVECRLRSKDDDALLAITGAFRCDWELRMPSFFARDDAHHFSLPPFLGLFYVGWQLEQRGSDKAWMVDRIDWQDFRGKCTDFALV